MPKVLDNQFVTIFSKVSHETNKKIRIYAADRDINKDIAVSELLLLAVNNYGDFEQGVELDFEFTPK